MAGNELDIRKVFKQGDSLVVSIPKAIAEELEIADGDHVIIKRKDRSITIEKYFA